MTFNFSRCFSCGDAELDAAPTFYPSGTPVRCEQLTGSTASIPSTHTPRIVVFGADPIIDDFTSFAGWTHDPKNGVFVESSG
jgi:hypothetical protein